MKKMNNLIFTIVFVISITSIAFSDLTSSITSLVGRNAEGYLAPLGTMMGSGMNSGFYRKASPHKILGFDLTLDIAYALAPVGQTTYDFVIPDDSIGYSFPFQVPKSYLVTTQNSLFSSSELLANIPDAGTTNTFNDDGLFQDLEIGFNLPLNMLMEVDDTKPAQNILGDSTTIPLEFDFGVAGAELFSQIVDGTWLVAKEIDGIGKDYEVKNKTSGDVLATIPAAFDSATFRDDFAANEDIMGTLESTLEAMNISLPIPGGVGHLFPANYIGLPLPIAQISIGLPFHTEVTARGLPFEAKLDNFGSIKFGGYGGKIGISEFFKKKPKKQTKIQISPQIQFVLEELPSNITPADVDSALTELRSTSMDLTELYLLNEQYHFGDSMAIYDIRTQLERITKIPKQKKIKPKGWPIDVSLGYYTNDLILNLDGQVPISINSINRMYSLQFGKTLNFPWINWLGGIGIYGGLGFESSNLSMDYTFNNPLSLNDGTNDDIKIKGQD